MTHQPKENILIVFTYNCVMLAMAFAAFAFSITWSEQEQFAG